MIDKFKKGDRVAHIQFSALFPNMPILPRLAGTVAEVAHCGILGVRVSVAWDNGNETRCAEDWLEEE